MGQKIAIVGSGIAGLGAAWALSAKHDITVFEATDRVGGHSNTVDVTTAEGTTPVDTGFIVYNEVTYPNLTRLFDHIGVRSQPSDMSFAFSLDASFEYAASFSGIAARPGNLFRRNFLRTLLDINKFRRIGSSLSPRQGESIQQLLERSGFESGFINDYLLPMTGAIWSTSSSQVGSFAAAPMLDFLSNHGLIEIVGRPEWRTVAGGSRQYVSKLIAPFEDRVMVSSPVQAVTRGDGRVRITTPKGSAVFDQVVFACHSDQILQILGTGASPQERELLSKIPYQPNVAYLHSDRNLMPTDKRVWASWNAMASSDNNDSSVASVSYWMNRLQSLPTEQDIFVSLNPLTEPRPHLIHGRFEYDHPRFGPESSRAQEEIAAMQGTSNTWFAGAWLGYGFHEDGLQSGLNVAAALGCPAPWAGTFTPKSSAPVVRRLAEVA